MWSVCLDVEKIPDRIMRIDANIASVIIANCIEITPCGLALLVLIIQNKSTVTLLTLDFSTRLLHVIVVNFQVVAIIVRTRFIGDRPSCKAYRSAKSHSYSAKNPALAINRINKSDKTINFYDLYLVLLNFLYLAALPVRMHSSIIG